MNSTKAITRKTAFVNANVVTMRDDKILINQTVLVSDGKIESIRDSNQTHLSEDAFVIDGKGKYLMPSLIDMHVHLGDNEDDLLLFLVNGVTTIRNMWGYENFKLRNWLFGTRVFNHLALRDKIDSGLVLGPSIVTAGPMIEGEKPFFPGFMVKSIKSVKDAEEVVRSQAEKGYDLIKFYSTLSEEVFDALVRTAVNKNICIAGHVPDRVGIRNVVRSKVTSVEHLLGFFNPYNPECATGEDEIPEIARLSAENNVYHCPTLIASERICNIGALEQYQNEPEMEYLPGRVKKGMKFLLNASDGLFKKKKLKPNHEYLPFLFKVIRELKKQNAGILLGTDKGTPFVVAGFSVHRELRLLNDAGLTPYEALRTGTVNAAKCLRKESEIGTIEVGKRADVLLVEQNPFDNLETISRHSGVMVRGKWMSRDECDTILSNLKRKNSRKTESDR
jgi:hypothetical protein